MQISGALCAAFRSPELCLAHSDQLGLLLSLPAPPLQVRATPSSTLDLLPALQPGNGLQVTHWGNLKAHLIRFPSLGGHPPCYLTATPENYCFLFLPGSLVAPELLEEESTSVMLSSHAVPLEASSRVQWVLSV